MMKKTNYSNCDIAQRFVRNQNVDVIVLALLDEIGQKSERNVFQLFIAKITGSDSYNLLPFLIIRSLQERIPIQIKNTYIYYGKKHLTLSEQQLSKFKEEFAIHYEKITGMQSILKERTESAWPLPGAEAAFASMQNSQPVTSSATHLEPLFKESLEWVYSSVIQWVNGYNVLNELKSTNNSSKLAGKRLNTLDTYSAESIKRLKLPDFDEFSMRCNPGLLDNNPTLQCIGEKYSTHVFVKTSDNISVATTRINTPVTLPPITGDHYDVSTCKPVTYYNNLSVYCEGEKTTLLYNPNIEASPWQDITGPIVLFTMTVYLFKQTTDWLKQKRAPKAERVIQSDINEQSARVKLSNLQLKLDLLESKFNNLNAITPKPIANRIKWISNGISNYRQDIEQQLRQKTWSYQNLQELEADVTYFYGEAAVETQEITLALEESAQKSTNTKAF